MHVKMNREQKFNQHFVRTIKAHPCLYNGGCAEYRNREMQEEAWSDVSKKCGESEELCKRRWRNLKTSTARYLKQRRAGTTKDMKEYYLYEDMKFMIPHLKPKDGDTSMDESRISIPRKAKTTEIKSVKNEDDNSYQQYEIIEAGDGYIVTRPEDETEHDPDEEEVSDHEDQIIHEEASETAFTYTEQDHKQSKPKMMTIKMPTAQDLSAQDFIQQQQQQPPASTCPDEMFLKSLLPDILTMNNDQKRKFKIGVLSLVDNLLSP